MEDDTAQGCSAFNTEDIEQAKSLWKFTITRTEALTWASQDIQFLVYDDTDDTTSQNSRSTCIGDGNTDVGLSSSIDPNSSRQSQITESRSSQCFSDSPEDAGMQKAIWESLNGATNLQKCQGRSDDTETGASDPETDEEELNEAIRLSLMEDTEMDASDPETEIAHAEAGTSNPETNEEELNEANRLSLMNGEGRENNLPQASPESSSAHRSSYPECRICSAVPAFPHDRKTRKFRIFKPAEELPGFKSAIGFCTHYVAVSYCWPEPVRDQHGDIIPPVINSQVRDLGGKQRRARALDHVLDAAVDFANSCSLRMIWIDQECLPQPQPGDTPSEEEVRYKQLGVQAMDSVYNKACVTLGLHSYKVTSQLQANAIRSWIDYAKNRGPLVPNIDMMNGLLDFLKEVQLDRWYTRAWVIQEAISSGSNLLLAFPKAPGISYPCTKFRRPELLRLPRHPLDTDKRVLNSELIAIPVGLFQDIVGAARALVERRFQPVGQLLLFRPDVAFPTLKAAESLHPKVTARQDPWNISIISSRTYGPRRRVDAATAVTLLSRRGCRDVQDRVTIVANMCNYEIRLNTDKVGQHCKSLRVGYLAIALLNGDLSLLVPELYEPLWDNSEITLPTESIQMGSLFSPFDTNARLLNHIMLQEGCLAIPRVPIHTYDENHREGLQFPAYGWTVDNMLDLSILKYEYAELWHSIKCVQIATYPGKEESDADIQARQARFEAIGRHFGRKEVNKAALRELLDHRTIAPGSSIWGGLDSTGVRVTAILNAYRVKEVTAMQDIVAKIVFAILRYLHGLSTPQSIGVANSIWQSLRVDAVDKPYGSGARDLPDTVGDELFTHRDVVKAPFHTLQLDKSRDGSYYQVWLIDRIMYQGYVWTGTYRHTRDVPIESPPNATEGSDEDNPLRAMNLNILDKQWVRRYLATQFLTLDQGDAKDSTLTTTVNSGTMTYFIEALAWGSLFTPEADHVRRKELVAVFDVDGPCIVATPFNHEFEVLPHPSLRSMSVCWVIEPVKKLLSNDGQAQIDGGEGVSTQVSRKGKEPATTRNLADTSDFGTHSENQQSSRMRTEDEDTLFQVRNKVKGMWQIMDPTQHLYSFV
ncbi:hypothetical protein PG995_000090 [Apiospora arundinis]